MRKIGLVILSLVFLPAVLFPQEANLRGLKTRVNQLVGQNAAVGNQYAVLIAINKYSHWNALRNPVKDALEIKGILSSRYYVNEFIELYDEEATKAGIIKLFDRLIKATTPEDSVFIFYAGHGHLDKISDTGFWIPVDGGTDRYEQLNWLPNTQIRGFISKMKARHIVLVSDACFAGDILNPTRAISPEISNEYFRNAYSRVSRQVLTSGASETVPDESPFARGLKLALEGNTSSYLDPLMLYNEVRLGVKGTTPLFGDLKDSGHQEGASFLLFLKEAATPPAPKQAIGADQAPKATFKLEKTYGTLKVETATSARLFLDEAFQGEVPAGSRARIENLEAGKHLLEMWYEDGGYESRDITVVRDTETQVVFEYQKAEPPASATPVEEAPPAVEEELANNVPLPVATIKIDGKLEDWKDVPPAFIDEVSDRGNMDIERAYIAKDDKYIYTRIDIADQRPTTWLRPHNFDNSRLSLYSINIMDRNFWLGLTVQFDIGLKRWITRINTGTEYSRDYKIIGDSLGAFSLKGSSLEARFPLSAIDKYILKGHSYMVNCGVGYNDEKGKWVLVDEARAKTFTF